MSAGTAPETAPVRALGPVTLVLMTAGTIVGAGIIGLPSVAYAAAGERVWTALTVGTVVAIGFALVFRALARRFDGAGGPYLYCEAAFGPWVSVPTGVLLLVARTLAGTTMLAILLDQAGLTGWGRAAGAVAVTGGLAALFVAGIRVSAFWMNALALIKLGALTVLAAVGVVIAFGTAPHGGTVAGAPNPGTGVLAFLFALAGFESPSVIAAEATAPRRDLPFAVLSGVGIAALLYAALMFACLRCLPDLGSLKRPLVELAALAWPGVTPFAAAVAILLLLSSLGLTLLMTPRLVYAMALDGRLPRMMGVLHPRWRTPAAAIMVISAVTLIAALLDLQTLVNVGTIARIVTWVASTAAYGRLVVAERRPAVVG